jgi:tape measure domain-containing protein
VSVVANVAINVDSSGAQQSLRQFQQGVKATDNAVSGLFKTVGKLAIALGAIQAVKFVFVKTAELESQTRSLEVLTGSATKAKQIIQELQQLGAVTPFTSSELIDSAKRLQAFGVEADKVVQTTKRLADVSGATGAELSGLVTAYGQVQAKGRLQGEELLQFQERGVALQGELQKMYGLSGQELRKALEKGRISAEAVEVAINRLTEKGGKYANGAIAQSDTLNGRFSTLMDNIEMLAKKIGQVLEPAIKGILNIVMGIVDKLSKFLDDPELKAYLDVATKIMSQSDKAAAGDGKKTANNELFNTRAEIKKLTAEIKAAEKAGIGMSKGLEIKGIDNNVIIPSAPVLPIMKAELEKLNKEAIELENRLKEFKKPNATKADVNLKTPALLEDKTKKLALEKQLSDARIQYERQIADFRESTIRRIADMERTLQDQRIKGNFDLEQSQLKLAGKAQYGKDTSAMIAAAATGQDTTMLSAARDSAKSLNDAAVTRRQIEFDSTIKKIQLERTLTDFKKGIEREIGEMQKSYARQVGDILTRAGINIQSAMIAGAKEVEAILTRLGTGMSPPAAPELPAANSQFVRRANDQPNQQANSAAAGVGRIITPSMTQPRAVTQGSPGMRAMVPGAQSMQVDAVNNIRQFSPATAKLDQDTNVLKNQETQAAINQILDQQVTKTNELKDATLQVTEQSMAGLKTSIEKSQADQRTLDLIVSGTNPALAAQFAQNEQLNAQNTLKLEAQQASVQKTLEEKGLTAETVFERRNLVLQLDEQISKQPQILEGLNQQAVKQKEINDASAEFASKQQSIKNLVQGIGSSIESGIIGAIDGAITGAKSLQESLADILKDIGKMLISFGIRSLLGGINIGGVPLVGRAAGGPVSSNSTYMVGEKGPELFVPGSSGTIVPNHKLGGGGDNMNVVVNVDATGSKVEGDMQGGKQLGTLLAAAVQKELIKQKRPGGILA